MSSHITVDMPCGKFIYSPEWPQHKKTCQTCQTTSKVAEKAIQAPCGLTTPKFQYDWHVKKCQRCNPAKATQPTAPTEVPTIKSFKVSTTFSVTTQAAPHQVQSSPDLSDIENRPPVLPPSDAALLSSGFTQSQFEQMFTHTVKRIFDETVISDDNGILANLLLGINGLMAPTPEVRKVANFTIGLFMSHIEKIMLNNTSNEQLDIVCFALHSVVTSPIGLPVINVLFPAIDHWIRGKLTTQSVTPAQFDNLQRSLQVLNDYLLEDPIWAQTLINIDKEKTSIPQLVETWIACAMSIDTQQTPDPSSDNEIEVLSQEESEEAWNFLEDIRKQTKFAPALSSSIRIEEFMYNAQEKKIDLAQTNAALSQAIGLSIHELKILAKAERAAPSNALKIPLKYIPEPWMGNTSQEELEGIVKFLDEMAIQVDSSPITALESSIRELQKLGKYAQEATPPANSTSSNAALPSVLEAPEILIFYKPPIGATDEQITGDIFKGLAMALQEGSSEKLAYWISTMGTGAPFLVSMSIRTSVRDKLLDWMQRVIGQQEEYSFEKLHALIEALNMFGIGNENNQRLLKKFFDRLKDNILLSLQKSGPLEKTKLQESLQTMVDQIESQEFSEIKQIIHEKLTDELLGQLRTCLHT